MKSKYTLYWYRLESYKDPYTQGYIGVTNNWSRRQKEHIGKRNLSSNTHFANVLNKYKDRVVVDILGNDLSYEEANLAEFTYRPQSNIGWNQAIGGIEEGIGKHKEQPIYVYHKDDPTKVIKYESIKSFLEVCGRSHTSISRSRSKKTIVYDKSGWAISHTKDQDRANTPSMSDLRSLNAKYVRTKPSVFKGKKRWSDEDKQRISAQHKGKTISEEQRKVVSEKHKLNHPSCKRVELAHEDNPDKKYEYHSMSEAARQLDIPLPRIKSWVRRKTLNKVSKSGWYITRLG